MEGRNQALLQRYLQCLMLDYIQTKGLETVSVDKLIEEITPHARGIILLLNY